MAFDRPLEADRVDDLNLFSTFIRAPVVGTLMWILGGKQAKEEDEEERSFQATVDKQGSSPNTTFYPKSALKKSSPSLKLSDISCTSQDDDSRTDTDPHGDSLGRRKKELSWSDQSGKDLFEIMNEEETTQDQPPSDITNIFQDPSQKRYVPRGLDRPHNHIQLPQHVPRPSDGESPLWGWYVRTTPPTPDLYPSKPVKSKDFQPQPNTVFQEMQDKNKTAPLAFPSIPL